MEPSWACPSVSPSFSGPYKSRAEVHTTSKFGGNIPIASHYFRSEKSKVKVCHGSTEFSYRRRIIWQVAVV